MKKGSRCKEGTFWGLKLYGEVREALSRKAKVRKALLLCQVIFFQNLSLLCPINSDYMLTMGSRGSSWLLLLWLATTSRCVLLHLSGLEGNTQ